MAAGFETFFPLVCYFVRVHFVPPAPELSRRRRTAPEHADQVIRELEDEVADLRAELERSDRRVEAMKQIQRTLGSNLSPDHLLRELVHRTTELLEADRSTLFLIDDERSELVSRVLEGDEVREIRLPRGVGLAGWVAVNGEPVHIKDAYNDARFNPEVDKKTGYRTRCMLVWPVRPPREDRVIGVIQVLNKRIGPFETTDERLLESIASSVGVALEVMTLYKDAIDRTEELERARSKLELLFETERAISQSPDLESMLDVILSTALNRLQARSATVYLLDDRELKLEVVAAAGSYKTSLKKMRPSLEDRVLGSVVRRNVPVVIKVEAELRRGRVKVQRVIAVPITTTRAGTIGVLELLNRKADRDYTENDAKALEVVAGQAGRAVHAERQRARRERAGRLAAIGKMLSGVVHDLRTPMTLINGYSQLMVGADDPIEREEFGHGILKQIEVMASMTKDLLGYAKGERKILVRKVYVQRFMNEMHAHLSQEMDGTGVSLHMAVGYKGAARFDETKMRRVFHNIARNAVEAMPGGGAFEVSIEKTKDQLVFVLADDGPGVLPEIESRLFDDFATAGKVGGTGLGLAMVKQIVEEHRGTIVYDSDEDGTRFTIRLPLGL